jgi:hypothetical protein
LSDALRLILLLAIAGAAVTVLGSGVSWWMDEERRLNRYIRRSLGGEPDAVIVVRGRAAAAAFSLASSEAVVMWRGGAKALLYPLHAFLGAELIVDDVVVARVFRGEPRRALDAVSTGARTVTLRLIFDNPRDPDFDLDLWLPPDSLRRDTLSPGKAIQQGRTWLARVDSLLRLAAQPKVEPRIAAEPKPPAPPPAEAEIPPWEDDEDFEDDVEPGREPRDLFDAD